jgi:DNA mismatch repair ATPase MutL
MTTPPTFAIAGTEKQKIDVRLSYRIVRLFSEGLYASPNKAVEELVANSFDAGATHVAVFLPSDFHDQGATIGVLDNGEGTRGS